MNNMRNIDKILTNTYMIEEYGKISNLDLKFFFNRWIVQTKMMKIIMNLKKKDKYSFLKIIF